MADCPDMRQKRRQGGKLWVAESSPLSYHAQLTLYFAEAVRHEAERHAQDIVSSNLGLVGGKEATKAIRELTGRR